MQRNPKRQEAKVTSCLFLGLVNIPGFIVGSRGAACSVDKVLRDGNDTSDGIGTRQWIPTIGFAL
jgi:hypothetical protein